MTSIRDAWCRFWFSAEPMYTLGLVRIVSGIAVVVWTLTLLPDLFEVFGEEGVAPQPSRLDYQWTVLEIWRGDTALSISWALLLVSALALTVGWHSRVAAVLMFVLLQSFVRRGVYIVNAGDAILIIVALILALCSCGAALSLDQRRRTGSFWSAQTRSVWPVRLLQVQLSVIYLVSVQAKLTGKTWLEGSAVFYAWRSDGRWATWPAPEWLASNAIAVNALTWATLLIELALAVLVWNRRLRLPVLIAGVVMHLAIMINLNIAFFSVAMFVLYVAFVPADAVRDAPSRLRNWRSAEKAQAA
ncbi:HTTM domain-containing protein [Mycobacterium deserti]|uniref:HTTM domain-containing protein n=1 Tax=Mycobacterium deserti TaxID=2978347 RepID=A0ABT2M7L7_9MYCO|nr:HTTM domain-containing protein [Mycobacterium deserti]MCT7657400.1 HTTM domain-containing protein [Mycobacterium deserti]